MDLGTTECTGITVAPYFTDSTNRINSYNETKYSCYRKRDVVFGQCDYDTKFDTYVRQNWAAALGFNCYQGHGASDIDGKNYILIGTVSECKQKCEDTPGCSGIVFYMEDNDIGVGSCYRKANITLNNCDRQTEHFDVYLRSS